MRSNNLIKMAKKRIKPIKHEKTGRPKLDIDKSKATYLCELHCTQEEIAGILDISQDTLIRTIQSWGFVSFAEFFNRYSANGKLSLRRAQFVSAVDGNIVMQKHLGINWLKQKTKEDQPEESDTGKRSLEIVHSYISNKNSNNSHL